jgi:hypothetical protein
VEAPQLGSQGFANPQWVRHTFCQLPEHEHEVLLDGSVMALICLPLAKSCGAPIYEMDHNVHRWLDAFSSDFTILEQEEIYS